MRQVDKEIFTADKAICRHIGNAKKVGRPIASQDALKNLRDLVDNIALKIYDEREDLEYSWVNMKKGIKYINRYSEWLDISRFHKLLQQSVSHTTPNEENSERLMLKYYPYLKEIKKMMYDKFSFDVLANLDEFPLDTDNAMQEFYDKIAGKIETVKYEPNPIHNKYYIKKIKTFYSKRKIYYEVTFTLASDHASKFDRIIAFTDKKITDFYAVKISFIKSSIDMLGRTMPILIINEWEVSIRNCEFYNFTKLVRGRMITTTNTEQIGISRFLTEEGINLSELVEFSDKDYNRIRNEATHKTRNIVFFEDLDLCRKLILKNAPGSTLLRYLLLNLNNRIIKAQYEGSPNLKLSGLFVNKRSIPFNNIPYNFNPRETKVRIRDVFACISPEGREHEFLARYVKDNTEIEGTLFTPVSDVKKRFGDNINFLIKKY